MRIHPLLPVIAAGISGLGIGIVVGYKIAYSNLEIQFEERLLKETEGMREFYQHSSTVKKPFSTAEEAAAALIEPGAVLKESPEPEVFGRIEDRIAYHKIAKQYSPESKAPEPEINFPELPPELEEHNIFSDGPVIISQDVFMDNKSDFQQSTLTYYVVDKTLTDEREQVIEDWADVIGATTPDMFGEKSSDPKTVHVRNTRLGLEFEIVKHESSYRQEVLGIDEEPIRRPSGRG